jgi:hypothetical protein
MSNPTSNYGWQMPTATDLVTDLPADFAVFGQAVATSMADLLGGTTGQVLSKASNTNMDFTWIAQDDISLTINAQTGASYTAVISPTSFVIHVKSMSVLVALERIWPVVPPLRSAMAVSTA